MHFNQMFILIFFQKHFKYLIFGINKNDLFMHAIYTFPA